MLPDFKSRRKHYDTTPEKLLEFVKEKNIKLIDLQFMDIPGSTIPSYALKEEDFKDGIGKLDGSSNKGFKSIFESDVRMFPHPETCGILPWTDNTPHKTLRLICDLYEEGRDSRAIRGT